MMLKDDRRDFGELLIQSMTEAVAIERGKQQPARAYVVTARKASVQRPPRYDAPRVLKIRERMSLSQPVFAAALNVSPYTVRAWEQGKRTPEGAAERLLELAEASPGTFLRTVTKREPGKSRQAAPKKAGAAKGGTARARRKKPSAKL